MNALRHALRRLLREPALQFALAGAALFGLHQAVRWQRGEGRSIVIDRTAVYGGREPEEDTLLSIGPRERVERAIDDEVLYREAIARGLDRDDLVVRRRLVQKMDFLSQDKADARQPGEAELEAFRTAHAALFTEPAWLTLSHVFLSQEKRGAHLDGDARALLARLARDPSAASQGDAFLAGDRLPRQTAQRLDSLFGADFAQAAFALPPQQWSGPLRSSFGLHLVRVEERREARLPPLSAIRAQVASAWLEEQRARESANARAALRAKYRIEVDPELSSPLSGGRAAQP